MDSWSSADSLANRLYPLSLRGAKFVSTESSIDNPHWWWQIMRLIKGSRPFSKAPLLAV